MNGRGGIREVLQLALPMVISMAADTMMSFTDRLFMSRIGPEHLNATMGGSLGVQLLMFFFIGLTGFSTALIAQMYGAGRKEQCPSVLYQVVLILLAAQPVIFLLRPLAVSLFTGSLESALQAELEAKYFNVLIYGSFFFMLRHGFSCYFSGIGRTRIVMVANLTALVCNVGLNYVLIWGHFGFPAMGIEGSALATVISMFIACVIMGASFFARANRTEFQIFRAPFFQPDLLRRLFRFGYPAGVELFLNFGAFTVMMHIFYSHSAVIATAASILFIWDAISFIPLVGLEIAVTSLFGRYIGQKRLAFAHRSAVSALILGSVFSFAVFVLFLTVPEYLCLLFKPAGDSAVFAQALPYAVSMLRIATIYVLTETAMLVFIGALRGAGDTHWTMWASVCLHWLFAGVSYLMLKVLNMPPITTWYVIVSTFMLFGLVFYLRYRSGKWKDIDMLG